VSDQSALAAGSARLDVEFKRDRRRLTTLVQPLLALPQYLVVSVATMPLLFVIVHSWFALLITGSWPSAAFRLITGWLRAATRVWAYLNIVSDQLPPWSTDDDASYEVRLLIGPPKRRYSRAGCCFVLSTSSPAYLLGALGAIALMSLQRSAGW
jgi:hypothetical protein